MNKIKYINTYICTIYTLICYSNIFFYSFQLYLYYFYFYCYAFKLCVNLHVHTDYGAYFNKIVKAECKCL